MKPQKIEVNEVEKLLETQKEIRCIDEYAALLEDLFLIRNPRFKFEKEYTAEFTEFTSKHLDGKKLKDAGQWFLFPWNNMLVHYLDDDLHQELRTARNKNLINVEEQKKLRGTTVAIAGMSVGSHCALTLNMMGMARRMHIADPDVLSGSNMNRVRYDFTKIGQKKTQVALESLYQMDPYSDIHEYSEGVTVSNVDSFLKDVSVLIEETDHLETKIFLREEARKRGIPVIMATDNGDGIILDIERFDLDPTLALFNGSIGDITLEEFKTFPPHELPKLATKIAGVDLVVPKMLTSLAEVGKTLYSWPQLGDAATLCGVVVAFTVKQIALGLPLRSGKIDVSMEKILDPSLDSEPVLKEHKELRAGFKKAMGLE